MEKEKKLKIKATCSLMPAYAELLWPNVPVLVETNIIGLLQHILSPVGEYRKQNVLVSRGRRRGKPRGKKRVSDDRSPAVDASWMPDIYDHLTIGYNSTVSKLEALAEFSRPVLFCNNELSEILPDQQPASLAAVFCSRSALSHLQISSMPSLLATASLAYPAEEPIRLVTLSDRSEISLARALHVPRLGTLGIGREAPGCERLINLVVESIEPVDVPWLDGKTSMQYQPVFITRSEHIIGGKRKRKDEQDAYG